MLQSPILASTLSLVDLRSHAGDGNTSMARRRVVESLGARHEDDCCEPGCEQEHAFHYVRVRGHTNPPHRHKGAVDLKLDLHPRLRVIHPQALLRMTPTQLEVCGLASCLSSASRRGIVP